MRQAIIASVALTPTHDGEVALVVELRHPDGALSKVHIDPRSAQAVLEKAGVESASDLIGRPWSVVEIQDAVFASSRSGRDDLSRDGRQIGSP